MEVYVNPRRGILVVKGDVTLKLDPSEVLPLIDELRVALMHGTPPLKVHAETVVYSDRSKDTGERVPLHIREL